MNEDDYVYDVKRDEYDIYLTKGNNKIKLNIGHCYTLSALIVDWFDKIDDQFADYPFYNEADEETIVRIYFIFYGHGLYEITKNNNVIYSKNI